MFLKRLIQFLFQIDSAASSTDKQQAEAALSQVSAALQAESNLSEDTKVALLTWARTIQNKLYDVPSKTDTDTDAPTETTPEPETPPTNPDPDSNMETHPKPAPEPIPTPTPEVEKDPFQYVELSATDGNANKVTLQSALNTGSAIKILTPGTYPLTPPVLIKSQTLDLNGSTIKLNGRKYDGALFFLSGERPSIQNGTIQGSFDEPAVPLSDPNFFEGESLIGLYPYAYSNAKISNLKLHHSWGYAVCERTNAEAAALLGLPDGQTAAMARCYVYLNRTTAGNESKPGYLGGQMSTTATGDYVYKTAKMDLTPALSSMAPKLRGPQTNYQYISASNGLGYFRIISDRRIEYEFTVPGEPEPVCRTALQGEAVRIPDGAIDVSVTTYCKASNASDWKIGEGADVRDVGYVIYLSNHVGGLDVQNCEMSFNSSLGMCGTSLGATYVKNCTSIGNGRLNRDSKPSHTTVGFIDIEDNPTCFVSLENITSDLETNGAMLGAVTASVKNWRGGTVIIYRGLSALVENSDAYIGLFSNDTPTELIIRNSTIRGVTVNKLPNSVQTEHCTFYNCPVRTVNDSDGKYVYSNTYTNIGSALTGLVNIYLKTPGGWNGSGLSTLEGSHTQLFINGSEDTPLGKWKPMIATGDCFGLQVDDTIYPNGFTIHGAKIAPGQYRHPAKVDAMFGVFEGCDFDLSKREFCTVGKHMYDKPLEFNSCTIHNANNPLFGRNGTAAFGVGRGTVIVFKNCIIDKKDNICVTRANTPGIATAGVPTIEFIDCTFGDES
jgi:hypothetical protein